VTEAPSPFGTALQVLGSTAERLRDVEAWILDLLETEGRAVAWGMVEYILTSFRGRHVPPVRRVRGWPCYVTIAGGPSRVSCPPTSI
jgi:hypothetical protein